MVPTDSPATSSPASFRQPGLHRFKALLNRLRRRTRRFLTAHTLPRLADRACRLYCQGDAQDKCRRLMRSHIQIDPLQLRRFFSTSLGTTLLSWFEEFFHLPAAQASHDKEATVGNLLVQMMADPEGVSLLTLMRRFPKTVQINLDQLLLTAKRVQLLLQETEATIDTIRELAAIEAAADPPATFASVPDLRQPGPFAIEQSTLTVDQGDGDCRCCLQVVCYRPQPLARESRTPGAAIPWPRLQPRRPGEL
ncbi:hypothetical protein XM38_014240 [Halomicronema hongdechloris C2206]|uniref:DUF1400 domain-containing protein n=1 Tax=Halomicronema hongdechloris C2206 TaxID=1641165 RepID=A0A1Z3HJM5_9CYAN|nr:alpha/beta hydrolase [Halomicronema hongdechloris]ASC70485.1 hypothetical protein XM38_014240 [Halomicronema hongdechloris C2206]